MPRPSRSICRWALAFPARKLNAARSIANWLSFLEVNSVMKTYSVPLSAADYAGTIKQLADSGFTDGVVYDALIVRAARKSAVDRLVTLNLADFRRLWLVMGNFGSLPGSVFKSSWAVLGNRIIFVAFRGPPGTSELWLSDGSPEGTAMVKNMGSAYCP